MRRIRRTVAAMVACGLVSIVGCSQSEPTSSTPPAGGAMKGDMGKMDTGRMSGDMGKMDTGKMSGPMDKMDTGKMDHPK